MMRDDGAIEEWVVDDECRIMVKLRHGQAIKLSRVFKAFLGDPHFCKKLTCPVIPLLSVLIHYKNRGGYKSSTHLACDSASDNITTNKQKRRKTK